MKEKAQTTKSNQSLNESRQLEEKFKVKPYTLKELCQLYELSYKSMRSCLAPIMEKIGPKLGRCFTVNQVQVIIDHIGMPYTLTEI